ncbi:MarR family winged helix-turn-helix transcriptional regulator [Enterococcus sp. LJL90]
MSLLKNKYLNSNYSITEARVLFEVYMHDECTSSFIVKSLNIDKSYLSRIVKNFEGEGYLTKRPSCKDSRSYTLSLTNKGELKVKDFIKKSDIEIQDKFKDICEEDQTEFLKAIKILTNIIVKSLGEN